MFSLLKKKFSKLRVACNKLLFVVHVEGESAWPELISGKNYLASVLKKPRVGNYIVFPHPKNNEQLVVKKVLSEHGMHYEVAGNLPWASGSRDFGPVAKKSIIGCLLSIQ